MSKLILIGQRVNLFHTAFRNVMHWNLLCIFFVVALLFCCMMGHQDFKGTLRFVMFDGSDFICQWTILSTTLNIDRN